MKKTLLTVAGAVAMTLSATNAHAQAARAVVDDAVQGVRGVIQGADDAARAVAPNAPAAAGAAAAVRGTVRGVTTGVTSGSAAAARGVGVIGGTAANDNVQAAANDNAAPVAVQAPMAVSAEAVAVPGAAGISANYEAFNAVAAVKFEAEPELLEQALEAARWGVLRQGTGENSSANCLEGLSDVAAARFVEIAYAVAEVAAQRGVTVDMANDAILEELVQVMFGQVGKTLNLIDREIAQETAAEVANQCTFNPRLADAARVSVAAN